MNSLALEATNREATRFGPIAQRWQTILETAQRHLQEQAAHSSEIPQEYIARPALEPESAGNRFKGRLDIFREIETLVGIGTRHVMRKRGIFAERTFPCLEVIIYLPSQRKAILTKN